MQEERKPTLVPMSEEEAAQYKGRIPTVLVPAYNALKEKKKLESLEKQAEKKMKKFVHDNSPIIQEQKTFDFIDEFLSNGGKLSEAAKKVFNLKDKYGALKKGKEIIKKFKELAPLYMEKRGASYGRLMDIAIDRAASSKSPEWWDRVMKMADYEDFISKKQGPLVAIQNVGNLQEQLVKEYVQGDVEELKDGD